ncbi:MAG: aldo/keto reductase [Christensenellaceae bacterium]|jgi:diketogulonate reductase-like aldo/keto reductase|nr:aldo/keto reductase [Christensenellaceae bacterium]
MNLQSRVKLSSGYEMPILGLGVFKAQGEEAYNAVRWALDAGYRLIDTAAYYGNEESVGKAVRESGIPREELFVTTKLWNQRIRDHEEEAAFEESLKKLGIGYIDLFLIHWPVREERGYLRAWSVLERLQRGEKLRSIGVSNYNIHHLEDVLRSCEIKPAVNQVECHPELSQTELAAFCQKNGIVFEPWSPLGRGKVLGDPALAAIAAAHGKSPAQIVLRWGLQRGFVNIPKSVHKERILENADLFGFELSEAEMERIFALNKGARIGADPESFPF